MFPRINLSRQMATYVHMLKCVYKDDMESTKKEGERRKEKRVGRGSPEAFSALGFWVQYIVWILDYYSRV